MSWKHIQEADSSIVVTTSHCFLETIIFNTRGTGSFKVYDSDSSPPSESDLFADFLLEETDLLIQYLGSGVELSKGLVVVTPAIAGSITIAWRDVVDLQ
jgi:hypothetical protein